jgi:UBA-like domain
MAEEADQRAGIQKPVSKPLDVTAIRAIIDEEIAKFEDAWTEKELPKVEKGAWRFYRREKKLRRRIKTIAKFKEEFEHVNERVDGLRAEYETVEWRNERDLMTKCGNLELSIFELKKLQWNIEMLKGNPPPKPAVIDEEDEDEEEEDVEAEAEMNQMVDIEAVVEDEEEGEEEDDLDEVDDDDEEEEDDDLGGFIIDDYDLGQGDDEPMDDLDDDLDADDEQDPPEADEAIAAAIIESAIKSPRRTKRLRQVLDDSEMEADTETAEPVEPIEGPPEPAQTQTTMHPSSKGKEPMDSQSTSLPTPPQEDDVQEDDVMIPIKDEPMARPNTADSTVSLDGYDSDIFMCFGDEEISQFVDTTQVRRELARDYLLRADGKVDLAIDFYYKDLANGLVPDKSRKKKKKKGKEKEERIALDLASDAPIADIFRTSFAAVLPKPWKHLREFLSNLIPEDLHQTLIEISELQDVDPKTAFLEAVTAEDCGRYWSLYRTYLFDMFGKVVDTLEPEMHEQLCKPTEFQNFYDRLSRFLNVDPPGPSSSKQPLSSQLAPPPDDLLDIEPSSQISALSSPEKSKKRDKGKSKSKSKKPAKPITKSIEEMNQDRELKRIADREKQQKKKGIYMTKTAEGAILINPGKKVFDDAVTFHPRLAAVMKPHQIEGAQFLWRHVLFPCPLTRADETGHYNGTWPRHFTGAYNGSRQNSPSHIRPHHPGQCRKRRKNRNDRIPQER